MTARKTTARPVPVAVAAVSVDEMAALRRFASAHGRSWKNDLLGLRLRGALTDSDLVRVVNRLGPSAVRRLKLATKRNGLVTAWGHGPRPIRELMVSRTINGRRWTASHNLSFRYDSRGGDIGKDTVLYLDSFPVGQAIKPGLSDDGRRYGFEDFDLWPFKPREYESLSAQQQEARSNEANAFMSYAAKRIVAARKPAKRA